MIHTGISTFERRLILPRQNIKKKQAFYKLSRVREIFYEFVATRLGNIFSNIVYSIFCELLLRYLFYLDKNTPFDMHSLKVNLNGLQMDFPLIFNIRMLIISWLCALFGSNFYVISNISLLEKLWWYNVIAEVAESEMEFAIFFKRSIV